jgi:ABC-type antimicrobial peptide transport system permease subunit
MSNFDLIKMALRNLFKRKLRTFLTVLGVVIGCASIVVMVSLGVGMNANFDAMISRMGNILVIEVQSRGFWNESSSRDTPILDDEAVLGFTRINGVDAASPLIRGNFTIMSGRYSSWASVRGVDMSLYEELGYKVAEGGRTPDEHDSYGVIVGEMILANFYDMSKRNPWQHPPAELDPFEDDFAFNLLGSFDQRGRPIEKPTPITITGLIPGGGMNDYEIYRAIEDVKKLNAEKEKQEQKNSGSRPGGSSGNNRGRNRGYETVLVKCDNMKAVGGIQETIREMGYDAWSNGEWLSNMQNMSESLQGLLGAIGAVSLFVAAIGIANTMLMAIYERTKEIGVMKVIGATLSDIRKLFLVEAGIIGFFGGALGLGVSFGVSYVLNNSDRLAFLDMISWNPTGTDSPMSIIPMWLCGLALIFSTVIGVVSGYFPARRAMKLSALAAIRTE